jgi:hypothetical protein
MKLSYKHTVKISALFCCALLAAASFGLKKVEALTVNTSSGSYTASPDKVSYLPGESVSITVSVDSWCTYDNRFTVSFFGPSGGAVYDCDCVGNLTPNTWSQSFTADTIPGGTPAGSYKVGSYSGGGHNICSAWNLSSPSVGPGNITVTVAAPTPTVNVSFSFLDTLKKVKSYLFETASAASL